MRFAIGSLYESCTEAFQLFPGALIMANNTFEKTEPLFNTFNTGLTLFVLGISLFLCLGISIPILVEGVKNLHHDEVRPDLA